MRVVDPGYSYELAAGIGLVFLQKEDGRIVHDGTTNEEVLEALIDHVTESYLTLPCRESVRALYLLREALGVFRTRSARRARANIEGVRHPHSPVDESLDVVLGGTRSCEPDAPDLARKRMTPSEVNVEVGSAAAGRESASAISPASKKRSSVSARSAAQRVQAPRAPWVTT